MKIETSRTYRGNRSLADSRIKRSGLSRGTIAPPFRLPLVTGGEIELDAYRGRRLLLVFSDPQCRPCRELMPELESLRKRTPDIEVLVVSRGEIEAVKAEFADRPVSFPVAVQRRWEISRRYGMFATPIGYLIDEAGVLASDVATGSVAILVLLASAQIFTLLKSVKKLQNVARKSANSKQPEQSRSQLSRTPKMGGGRRQGDR